MLTDLFHGPMSFAPFATQEEERAAIADAQAGSETAFELVLATYTPALRSAVGRFRGAMPEEDAQAVALATIWEAVSAFSPLYFRTLAELLPLALTRALSDACASEGRGTGPSIPSSTLRRFRQVMRLADGDMTSAETLAPTLGLSVNALREIAAALRVQSGGYLDREILGFGAVTADIDTRELSDRALDAVSGTERRVVELAYGFLPYPSDPMPDAEIGARLGIHRRSVQRIRTAALERMRAELTTPVARGDAAVLSS